ncbi:Lipoprotein NlpI precursor [Serratia plymuthica]|uniref:Lipoprotein NlpI n=1 Tax=Serratia plymuthica TaxID=82996 RepID=A0A2X4TTH4_SERPL|nr:Lipoprotein NlpI precursor [Serratia plymuthica]
MKPFLRWCYVATALMLAGCSNHDWRKDEVLAIPLQPTLQQEVILARMEQILASRALTDDERAQLLYERGVLYDSLGLRALARNDFSQALAIRPDMPEVFNYLGIYLTQAGNFDAAYEAFDSVLELDPTYNYARLNRASHCIMAAASRWRRMICRRFIKTTQTIPSVRCGCILWKEKSIPRRLT